MWKLSLQLLGSSTAYGQAPLGDWLATTKLSDARAVSSSSGTAGEHGDLRAKRRPFRGRVQDGLPVERRVRPAEAAVGAPILFRSRLTNSTALTQSGRASATPIASCAATSAFVTMHVATIVGVKAGKWSNRVCQSKS